MSRYTIYDIVMAAAILGLITGLFLLAAAFDKLLTYHGI